MTGSRTVLHSGLLSYVEFPSCISQLSRSSAASALRRARRSISAGAKRSSKAKYFFGRTTLMKSQAEAFPGNNCRLYFFPCCARTSKFDRNFKRSATEDKIRGMVRDLLPAGLVIHQELVNWRFAISPTINRKKVSI
jgi:hypothetical protein